MPVHRNVKNLPILPGFDERWSKVPFKESLLACTDIGRIEVLN